MTLTLMLMRLGVCVALTSLVHLRGSFAYVPHTRRGCFLALRPALSTTTWKWETVRVMGVCDDTHANNDGDQEDRGGDAAAGSGFVFRVPPHTHTTATTTGTGAGSRIPKPTVMTPSGQVIVTHVTCRMSHDV